MPLPKQLCVIRSSSSGAIVAKPNNGLGIQILTASQHAAMGSAKLYVVNDRYLLSLKFILNWIFSQKKRNITFGKIDHHIAVFLIPGKGSFSGAIIYQIICKNLIKFPKDSDRFPNLKCKHLFKFTIGLYMDRHSGHIIWQKGTKVIKMLTNDAAIPTSYLSILVHHCGL